jgi:WD40 repeat protein
VESVAFSPDGQRALVAADDGSVSLWDTASGQTIQEISDLEQTVWAVRFTPDGQSALLAQEGGLELRSLPEGEVIRAYASEGIFYSAAFSPDGQYLLAGGYDGIFLYDTASGTLLKHLPRENERSYFTVAFTPDGKYALAGGGRVALFDFPALTLAREFNGHTGSVLSSAFSADGKLLATASEDGTTRIWDVATGQQVRLIASQQALANTVAFSLDGTQVYVGGADNTVWRWDVDYHALVKYACSTIRRDLTPEEREKYAIMDEGPVCGE